MNLKLSSILLQAVEMADQLRADGKIYVVAGVFSIITIGVILYLFSIDKKISKVEKQTLKD